MSAALKPVDWWAHPGGFNIYVWLSCKASDLTTEQELPLPQIIPTTIWWLAGIIHLFIYLLPSIFPSAPQSLSTTGALVIINILGETYYKTGARVKREDVRGQKKSWREDRKGVCIPLPAALSTSTFQSMHCTCAASNTSGYQPRLKGIFHVVSNFFPKPSSVTNERTRQASHAEDLSWEAQSFQFKDLPNGIFLCSMLSDVPNKFRVRFHSCTLQKNHGDTKVFSWSFWLIALTVSHLHQNNFWLNEIYAEN